MKLPFYERGKLQVEQGCAIVVVYGGFFCLFFCMGRIGEDHKLVCHSEISEMAEQKYQVGRYIFFKQQNLELHPFTQVEKKEKCKKG